MNRQNIYDQLKIDEGVVYEIYEDHLGYATFGVGHLVTSNDQEYDRPVGTPVSEERVRLAFDQDLKQSEDDCGAVFGRRAFNCFPGEVREILINMMFNLGRTRFTKFKKMIAAINCFDYREAAKEGRDSLWYRQVTNRAERLMTRLEDVF